MQRFWLFTIGIVITAFLIRVGVVIVSRPWSDNYERLYLYADARNYHNLAVELATAGRWSDDSKANVTITAPGWPIFLGFFYKVFGVNITTALFLNAFLSALTCLMLIVLTRAIFEDRAGLIAGALFALHPHSIRFTAMLYSETLYLFLAVCFLMLLVIGQDFRKKPLLRMGSAASASLMAALSVTTRIGMLYFAPLIAAVYFLLGTRRDRKSGAVLFAFFTVLFIMWLLPWFVYNKREFGAYRISASGEYNLLALTVAGSLAPDIDTYHSYKLSLISEAYERASRAGARNAFEASPYFVEVALEKVRERPVLFAVGMLKGFFNLWFRPIQSQSERAADLTKDIKNAAYIYYSYIFQAILFLGWCATLLMARRLPSQWVTISVVSVLYFWAVVGNAAYSRFFLQTLPYILPTISATLLLIWRFVRGDVKRESYSMDS